MNKLAIVIPAFKIRFLSQTLDSIARQSCKDFTLYIGDDNSPDDIYSVVREYEDVIDIVYKKFPENLGSKDLLSHWERCIDMALEPYIFFFSDDDAELDEGAPDQYCFLGSVGALSDREPGRAAGASSG